MANLKYLKFICVANYKFEFATLFNNNRFITKRSASAYLSLEDLAMVKLEYASHLVPSLITSDEKL